MERGWASSAMVTECSWLPHGWQWSASGPGGMMIGGAKTEVEAWEKARAAQRQLDQVMPSPQGFG